MDLLSYARIIRRRWIVVVVTTVLGLGLAAGSWAISAREQSFYRATHTLAAPSGGVNLDQAAQFVRTGVVPERVASELGGQPAALSAQVRPVVRNDVGFLELTAVGVDPQRTAEVADAFAAELVTYLDEITEQDRSSQIAALDERATLLRDQVSELQVALATSQDLLEIPLLQDRLQAAQAELAQAENELDRARAGLGTSRNLQTVSSAEPVPISGPQFREIFTSDPEPGQRQSDGPDPTAAVRTSSTLGLLPRLAFGGIVGLVLGGGLAILIERLDPRLRTKEDLEQVFGWPVLAEIPPLTRRQQQDRQILSHELPRSRTAEAYRVLRSAVVFASTELGDETDPSPTDRRSDGARAALEESEPPATTGDALPTDPPADEADPETTPDAPMPTDGDRERDERAAEGATAAAEATVGDADPETPERPPDATEDTSDTPRADDDTSGREALEKVVPPSPGAPRGRVVLVTSPSPSEGKTTTVANLAAVLGETGARVLVINCDFRRPTLGRYIGVADAPPRVIDTPYDGVKLLAQVGESTANPAAVVALQRQVVREARRRFDWVILDTAPVLTTNDANEILGSADMVLVAARAGRTTRESADRCAEALERRQAPVLGVVLVAASEAPAGRYYYYGNYYLEDDRGRSRGNRSAEPESDPTPASAGAR